MHIKHLDVSMKFIKTRGKEFFVDESITSEGIKILKTTCDPFKARWYTPKEAYDETYAALSEVEKIDIMVAHQEKNAYDILSAHVAKRFKLFSIDELEHYYTEDCVAEQKLLQQFNMTFVYDANAVKEKSIDKEPDANDNTDTV
jgi:hypothetical protein